MALFAFLIGTVGCAITNQDVASDMIGYINEKYPEDTFEFVSLSGGHLGSSTKSILAKSAKYPGSLVQITCDWVDGEPSYSDTYLDVKFEEQTRNYIDTALTSAFGTDLAVHYVPNDIVGSKEGADTTTFYEYISNDTTYVYFYAVVVLENVDEDVVTEKVKEAFRDSVLMGDIYFVNKEYASVVTGDNPFSIIKEKQYTKHLFIQKNDVDHYKVIDWETTN